MTATASSLKSPTYTFGPAAWAVPVAPRAASTASTASPAASRFICPPRFEIGRQPSSSTVTRANASPGDGFHGPRGGNEFVRRTLRVGVRMLDLDLSEH